MSNPLSALCRAVTRETGVQAVGLCNEMVGLQVRDQPAARRRLRRVDPTVAGVNHLPLVTSMRVGDDDGFAMLRALLDDDAAQSGTRLDGRRRPACTTARCPTGPDWTKADVLAGNRLKFELFRRFGVLPGSSDTHVAEFFPGFVTPASDFGREWSVHHYGLAGHTSDKRDDDQGAPICWPADEISSFPSGELVAPLLDSMLRNHPTPLPVNLPNTGQVENLPDGVVVECIGLAVDGRVTTPRPRPRASRSWASSSGASPSPRS